MTCSRRTSEPVVSWGHWDVLVTCATVGARPPGSWGDGTWIAPAGLIVAGLGVLGVLAFQWLGLRRALGYTLPGFIVWLGFLQAGVHPTLSGVVLGLLTRVATLRGRHALLATAKEALDELDERSQRAPRDPREPLHPVQQLGRAQRELLAPVVRVEAMLQPWVAYGIMPLCALANAGVNLHGLALGNPANRAVTAGIAVALIVGKPTRPGSGITP